MKRKLALFLFAGAAFMALVNAVGCLFFGWQTPPLLAALLWTILAMYSVRYVLEILND